MSRDDSCPDMVFRSGHLQRERVPSVKRMLNLMEVSRSRGGVAVASLPFALGDTTAGSESELQSVVEGGKGDVDLPLTIEGSHYFANIVRRAAAQDLPRKAVTDLERYLNGNAGGVWENSWVRFARRNMGEFSRRILAEDLLADKKNPAGGQRKDAGRFVFRENGEDCIRVPVSYLLKLCLAEVIGSRWLLHPVIHRTGCAVMNHFLSDNTSPETYSFHVVSLLPETGMGRAAAKETALRFLLCHTLLQYGNITFGLAASGQKVSVFFSPHPPVRLKNLNDCISDAFYRELFMNPCLAGWNKGEEKHRYMHLCHQVLSRSQLNAVAKLKEAGIVTRNLVALPNPSNISLANNGTHVSVGSRKLSGLLADPSSGFTGAHEKYLGDLVVKIAEHFLPLFVGSYSAAPYRLDFRDFHPEKALAFLPHEVDYTHLRMIWRRWRKKADVKICGRSMTPFGPPWLDRLISVLFRLRGDFVPDFRLIDYLVALLSTETSPALDGRLGNTERLREDLAELGIFDTAMSLYLFDKLRDYRNMGFSGFEGRYYSLFENLEEDMGRAVTLQNLIYLLAFKYIATERIGHAHIPDTPFVESERRQIVFGTAIGIPTFFVHKATDNAFLKHIVARTAGTRASRRYPGYVRIRHREYRKALLDVLTEDAADLIEMLQAEDTMADLAARMEEPERHAVWGRLTRGILGQAQGRSPLTVDAETFNRQAEDYYRTTLKSRHIRQAFQFLREDADALDPRHGDVGWESSQALRAIRQDGDLRDFLRAAERDVVEGQPSRDTLERLVCLMLVNIHRESTDVRRCSEAPPVESVHAAPTPVY